MKSNIQNFTESALMAAILCIVGPIVIPIGMVPMSFANMAIYLTILLLDKKKAIISVILYLFIGFIGLPVFSGFTGGVGKLFGPTGGYLMGYLVMSLIAGKILEMLDKIKDGKRFFSDSTDKVKSVKWYINFRQIWALVIGTTGLYFVGTLWLMFQSKLTFAAALSVGVLPFVFFDIIKIVAAVGLGNAIKKRMQGII